MIAHPTFPLETTLRCWRVRLDAAGVVDCQLAIVRESWRDVAYEVRLIYQAEPYDIRTYRTRAAADAAVRDSLRSFLDDGWLDAAC